METYVPHHPTRRPDDIRTWSRELRGRMTDAEALLWKLLCNRRLANAKFRRQHPVGRYILDFCCDEKKLGIELDGAQHADNVDSDRIRDSWLRSRGIHVLRFWNSQVLMETEGVMETIYRALTTAVPTTTLIPAPSPACGRRVSVR